MTHQKKIYIGFAGFTGFLLILLLVFHFQASTIINSEGVKNRIQSILSQKTGGKVEYKTAELSILPTIHVVLHQTTISIPGPCEGTINRLDIIPKILPLFTGKFLIDQMRIESPDITMVVTRDPDVDNKPKEPFNLDTFKGTVTDKLSPLAMTMPEFHLTMKDGGFRLIEMGKTIFALSDVQGEISCLSKEIVVKAQGTSGICKDIEFNANFDQKELKGKGGVELKHFQPQALVNRFLQDTAFQIVEPINKTGLYFTIGYHNDLPIDIDEIQIESSNIEMIVTRSPENGNETKKPFNIDTFKDSIAGVLSPLAIELPDFHFTMKSGGLTLIEDRETVFTLSNVQTEIASLSEKIEIKIDGTSDICEDISVIASFDRKGLKGNGEVELRHFLPQILIDHFLPNADFRITKPIDKVMVLLKTDGRSNLKVGIDDISVSAEYDGIPFPLQINNGRAYYDGENLGIMNLEGTFGSSPFSELTARMCLREDTIIGIQSGRAVILLEEVYPWISSFDKVSKSLEDLKRVSGAIQVSSLKLQGPLTAPETWNIEATGEVKNIIVETTLLPDPIVMKEGHFKAVGKTVLLTDANVNTGDISLGVSGTISHNMSELVKANIEFHGKIGEESIAWAENLVKLPSQLRIRPPLSIPDARLTWEKDSGISFVGNLMFQDGPGISLDMSLDPEGPVINNLLIEDAASSASITFSLKDKEIDFSFAGNLPHTTTDKIFLNTPLYKEWIKGNFHEHILLDHPENSTFQGVLNGGDFSLPLIQKIPLDIKNISLHADKEGVRVDSLVLACQDNQISINGDINISEDGIFFDLDTSSDGLDANTILKTLNIEDIEKSIGKENLFWDLPVKGFLRFNAESFTFDEYTLAPLRADISFEPDCISIEVIDANLCGISCPGVLKVTPQDILLDFQLLSHNQELGTTIKCFGNQNGIITGMLDLEAQVMARGTSEELSKSLHGSFRGIAKNGMFNRFGLISKVFSFLNLTETFRGKLPGLTKRGFPYKSITLNGEIQDGILMIDEYVLDAPSMGVTVQGTFDLTEKEVDLKVLVSPFKTVDFVVKKTPIIRGLLGGTLVSIPVKVKGDIENPKISYLSPAAVGKKLLNTTKRVLKAPVKIINPIIPGRKKNGSNTVNDRRKQKK